jgi:hypothetical protein
VKVISFSALQSHGANWDEDVDYQYRRIRHGLLEVKGDAM